MSKKPSLPQVPEVVRTPGQEESILNLRGLGERISRFDFTGDLSPLQQTIDLDPRVTELALESAQNRLAPVFRDTLNAIKQQAANAGALSSSTFANALAQAGGDLNQQFQAITSEAALGDRSRALQNRIGLLGTGLSTTAGSIGLGQQEQAAMNQAQQQRFQNLIGKQQFEQQNRGGIFGGLTGALGGGLAGFALGGPVGAAFGALGGGLSGGFGPSGTGGQFLSTGAQFAGAFPDRFKRPRSTAGAGRSFGFGSNPGLNRGLGVGMGSQGGFRL